MTVQHPEMPDPVSAHQTDPHFSPWAHSIQVKLDGHVIQDCVEASAKEGWIKVFVRGADGDLVVRDERFVTEVRHGIVELSWMESFGEPMTRQSPPNDKPESPAA